MNPEPESRTRDGTPRLGAWLLDKWRLDRLLGCGGMSSVYLATHRNGSQVAIKILHPELASRSTARRRFLREGYIANRVEHPDAVRVLDDGVDGPLTFLVMDLLHGQDAERLRRGRGGMLSPGEVVWLGKHILTVLGAAHAAAIIHRDVKPQNLFVTSDGRAKLLDFGVASVRGVPGFTTLTDAAALPGTPGYMAPEQVCGRHNALGPHTDIWGLGATLFRLLTGQAVHPVETAGEMMVATATQQARAVREAHPRVPRALAHVIDRALAFEPEARWASAEAMRAALESAARGIALRAEPVVVGPSTSDATSDGTETERSHPQTRQGPEAPSPPSLVRARGRGRGWKRVVPLGVLTGVGAWMMLKGYHLPWQPADRAQPTAGPVRASAMTHEVLVASSALPVVEAPAAASSDFAAAPGSAAMEGSGSPPAIATPRPRSRSGLGPQTAGGSSAPRPRPRSNSGPQKAESSSASQRDLLRWRF